MDTKLLILILNGLTQAAIFFVLGSGLTLAFGLMRVINLSHGAFYLLGGYIGYSVIRATGNWPLALVVGGLSIAALGFLFERTMLFRVRGGDLPETLLTVALSMIIADASLAIWGGHPLTLNVPAYLNPRVTIFGITYPGFRYILMGISVLIALSLWLILYRTKLGAAVQAGVDDRETVSALGVNIDVIYSLVFALSALLVGLAGVLGGSYLQLSPGGDTTILTYSLVIIILGGMGSLLGTVVSSLILGGRIEIFGIDITYKTVQERAKLGLGRTYQISQLFLNLTVEESLFLAAAADRGMEFHFLSSWRNRAKVVQWAHYFAEQVNLTPYLSKRVSELSHGLQRQLEVGMAIAMRSRLIMLDEPAAGLSPSERLVLTSLIKGLSREVTLILIEHDMEVVLDIADRITVLQHGSVIAEGIPAEIRTNQKVQDVYLGTSLRLSL